MTKPIKTELPETIVPEITKADLEHLERVIRDLADRKYVCPFNDRLILLLEHDKDNKTQLDGLDHDINGNDVPGIKGNVRTLMEERANRSKMNWLLVAAIAGNIIAIFFK
jgi:hypothetical protein